MRRVLRSYRNPGKRYALRLLATQVQECLLFRCCAFKSDEDRPLSFFLLRESITYRLQEPKEDRNDG